MPTEALGDDLRISVTISGSVHRSTTIETPDLQRDENKDLEARSGINQVCNGKKDVRYTTNDLVKYYLPSPGLDERDFVSRS